MPNICPALLHHPPETFTLGAYLTDTTMEDTCNPLILSHNYLNNCNLKYRKNDDSSEDNLTLALRSTEQKEPPCVLKTRRAWEHGPKGRSRTEQLHLYNHSRQRLYGSHSGTLSHLRNLTQHLLAKVLSSLPTIPPPTSVSPFHAGIRMDGNANRKMRRL